MENSASRGSPRQSRGRRSNFNGQASQKEDNEDILIPADIDLNMDGSVQDGASATNKRQQNSHRRSQMAEAHSAAAGGAESDEDGEADVKKMKINFDESKQIMDIVHEIEGDYGKSKIQINKFDTMALSADCSIKTLKQAYRVLKENLYKGNPNFDQNKTEATIYQLKQHIEVDATTLGALKGEYFAINDTVINKDVNIFKLEQVKRTRAKQLRVLEKLEPVEIDIAKQSKKIIAFEHDFHIWEKKLFEDQLRATASVVDETNQFMEEIDGQMDKMTQDILKIKADIAGVTPHTKEQIEKLNKINKDVAQVEKVLELADEAMERNDQTKEKLQTTHEECKEITGQLLKLEMVELVGQTRKIATLVTNLKDWEALYAALKALQENSIEPGDFDLAKATADAKKYVENVAGGRKEEYDDLIKKIQKAAKAIRDGADEQKGRIDDFTNKNLEGDISNLIPDQDLLFLNKEVTRYNGSIVSMRVQKDQTLEDSTKVDVDMKAKNKGLTIAPDDLHHLRQNLKALEKQLAVDLPRVKKNIDNLEAFAIKALKNKLNEDNKKSQNQISQMKRNYEDLQREIDNLNNKLVKVKDESLAFQKKFDNEDKEKDNDTKFKIEDKLGECDKDINGHKAEQERDERDKSKPLSLQARKKDIIAAINKMVNQFNENNKQIKENNKVPKTEKEMNDLIVKNKEIQNECKSIDDKVNDGKIFAEQIDERLNNILEPTIPELIAKYEEKNGLIDECDDLFDVCEDKLKNIDTNLNEQLTKVESAIEKLNDAGPINNPSSSDRDNKAFVKKVQELTEQGEKLRTDLEGIQQDMQDAKDRLMEVIQPLNELGDREVKTPEVQKILEKLKGIEKELKECEAELVETKKESDFLCDEVDKLIESEKNNKIQDADEHLGNLDKALGELSDLKKEALRKLQKYQDLIVAAKANEGQQDPQLLGTLKKLEKEAEAIKDQLKDIEAKDKDIRTKREDAKAMIDDAYANPDNYTPQQIDGIIDGITDLRAKVDNLNDKSDKIEQDIDRRILELKDLLAKNNITNALNKDIQDYLNRMKDDLASLKDVLRKLPEQIAKLLETLMEMKKGSVPDESADYWEERKDIDRWIAALNKADATLKKIAAAYEEKDKKFKLLQTESKKSTEISHLKKVRDELKQESESTMALLEEAYDCQDVVIGTQKEMSDCQIPVNIKMRTNEIDQFRERLANITEEFKELKAADDAYEGTTESEQDIKQLIEKIDRKLKAFETEKTQHHQYQTQKLQAYNEQEIFSLDNANIVREVRNFKEKIADTIRRLKELDEIMRELNNKLIAQDMENAAKLLGQKAENLRNRLEIAQGELKKISKCGVEMDGNTSHNEEEEFIDALKEEMPEVFKNIEGNFDQLDKIKLMIVEVLKTRQIETMQELKAQIDDSQTKVEQCEGLVNKLENEIIEWDAHRKLCRRDEELGEIDSLIKEFKTDLKAEKDAINQGKSKQEAFLQSAKDQNDINDANYLLDGIKNYHEEIASLEGDIKALDDDRAPCFEQFDGDIPSSVKVDRNKRNAQAGKKVKQEGSTASNKPEDMYYKLSVNCKYKQRIHELLKTLRNINQKRRELMEKYAGLKKDLNVVKQTKVFKALKGDAVDELWCWHLNKHQLDLKVERKGPGKYLFGTRNIMCKIINGKLVVRVGGGYMSADEFIEQYGKIEMLKAMKQGDHPDYEAARQSLANVGGKRAGSNPRSSNVAGLGDMKELMRKQLEGAKTYEEGARVGNGNIGDRAGSNKRGTIVNPGNKSPGANKMGSPMGSPKGGMSVKRQTSAGRGRV